jgi:hypothetical protein
MISHELHRTYETYELSLIIMNYSGRKLMISHELHRTYETYELSLIIMNYI